MDTHNIYICPIERYGYALKSVRDISRICEEEMRESNHMRDITHLYPTMVYACVPHFNLWRGHNPCSFQLRMALNLKSTRRYMGIDLVP